MKRFVLPTLIALAGTSAFPANAQQLLWEAIPALPAVNTQTTLEASVPLQWELVPDRASQPSSVPVNPIQQTSITWEILAPRSLQQQNKDNNFKTEITTESNNQATELVWEAVDPDAIIAVEDQPSLPQDPDSADQAIERALGTIEQKAATFANDRALWRNDRWLPQISNDVPVGFGPKGFMTSFAVNTIDCTASGVCSQPESFKDYSNQIERFGEAQYDFSLGMGDSQKYAGLVVTTAFEETSIPLGDRNTQSTRTTKGLFDNYYLGLHLSRNIGIDTAFRFGVENLIDIKSCGDSCGFPKSAYGVISQRIRLKNDQNTWFSNAYLTVGAGNGEFRSLKERFKSSVYAQKNADCSTFGYLPNQPCSSETRRRAVLSAANYGQLSPLGSAALEVYPGFNLISEWSQGNLNAGFSVRPFKDFGLVITSMWNTLIPNCDYGCDVNINGVDASIEDNLTTERAKWAINASLNIKF